jgi:hypothetical protein
MFNESGGYQGGRNPHYAVHAVWISIHIWSSIIMSVGVAAHLILHWNWMVCMTRRFLSSDNNNQSGLPVPESECEIMRD